MGTDGKGAAVGKDDRKELDVNGNKFAYYSLPDLGDERVGDCP